VGNVSDPNDVIRGVTIDELVQRITDSGTIDKAEVKRAVGLQRKQFPQGIPACGADALRFSLLSYTSHARDIKFDVEKVVGHRAFLNKVWNATRFVLHATADGSSAATVATLPPLTGLASAWIISRLASTVVQANAALEAFNFAQYTAVLQHFWITDFCDTYIELAKNDLRDPAMAPEARVVLLTCLQVGTELLAPATPFIAAAILEVLPHHVDGSQGLPASHTFPEPAEWEPLQSAATEVRMADVLLIAKAIRAVPLRQIDPQVKLNAYAVGETPASHALLQEGEATIRHLSRASSFTVLREGESLPSGSWVVPTQAGHPCAVAVTTATPLDPKAIQAELARLGASKHNLLGSRDKVVGRMQGGGYARAPEAVKERDAQTVVQLERQAEEIGALEAVYRGWLGTP
jgi:valyl-tRNA synthetase